MTETETPGETPSDFPQALLAECYLGGDASAEVVAAFEAAIDDPALLEQLVVAVQTRDALSIEPLKQRSTASSISAKRSVQWIVGLLTTTALGLTIILWPVGNFGPIDDTPLEIATVSSGGDSPAQEESQLFDNVNMLAPVWVDIADEATTVSDAGFESFSAYDEAEETDIDLANVPDWMYAVVALPAETGDLIESGALEGVLQGDRPENGLLNNAGGENSNEETL